MDDLYGDLENYNEVNIVEELRNENNDLKLKLEEYETAMGKLQKDYDNLVLEFQNLQTNYSSLLKTARAEVERKSQMITQLNLDKDAMVLKTLQNGNRRYQNKYNKDQKGYQNLNKTASEPSKAANKARDTQKQKNIDVKNERSEISSVSSNTTLPSSENIKLLNIVDKVVEKVDECISKGELKENIAHCEPKHLSGSKVHPHSIKERRKSMPAMCTPKFSSDEECETEQPTNSSTHNNKTTSTQSVTKNESTILSKIISETLGNRTSESSSIDSKSYNPQGLARDSNRSRPSSHYESDRRRESDRASDRYRESDRHRDNIRHRGSDRYRECDKYGKSEKFKDSEWYRENDRFKDSDKSNQINYIGLKYKEGYKMRDSDRFKEGDRYRESNRSRDSGKIREGDKCSESDMSRLSDKITTRLRESDRHRVNDRYYDRHRESDKFQESDKYREVDKFRERDKFGHIDKHSDKHAENYRGREKCDDQTHKYRKNSPERPHKRVYGEYQDDRAQYGRHRMLASPPPEPHSYYTQQKTQDPRSLKENSNREIEKYKPHYLDRHGRNHLITDDHEEPSRKRQKLESETTIESRIHQDKPPMGRLSRSETQEYEALRTSCQSPDGALAHTETTPAHIVREIKTTAVLPLEDPRVTSKKYILKEENGKTLLATSVSKSIDIKPVDKSLWNIESVAIPDALLHEPPTPFSDENIKEIYMDIENLESNITVESGEITSDTLDPVYNDVSKVAVTKSTVQDNTLNKHTIEIPSSKKLISENVTKTPSAYKIPINKQTIQDTQSKPSEVPKDLPNIVFEDNTLDKTLSKANESTIKSKPELPRLADDDHISKKSNPSKKNEHNKITLSDIAMVQDDLELSDEASDNVDLHKQILEEKEKFHRVKLAKDKIVDSKNDKKSIPKTVPEQPVDIARLTTIKIDDSPKEFDGHKKQKNKRRKTKSKEIELGESTDVPKITEKKVKPKKDKESKPKEIKSKFNDLFGDSSSLITPEDLGIPAVCVPLFEDAQDAVDINIKEYGNVPVSQDIHNKQVSCSAIKKDSHESTTHITLAKSKPENIEAAKRESQVNCEIDASACYQNLNAEEELNKPGVIKTVIISTGVQPQFLQGDLKRSTETRIADVEVNIQNIVDCNQPPVAIEHKNQNLLKALATSTPHKEFPAVMTTETDSRTVDCVTNSNDSKNESGVDKSDTNTHDCHDAPDVRIIVRRRKKCVKKT